MTDSIAANLRSLPAVDELWHRYAKDAAKLPRTVTIQAIRVLVDRVRRDVRGGQNPPDDAQWEQLVSKALSRAERQFLTPVINATGVVLHTNLGRAPLSSTALEAVSRVSGSYSNLEYDIERGQRGSRYAHGALMLTLLTGAEAALVVNNGAAAILLVLAALSAGREVILSRGEMIEIGGAFRIPEVMEQSGCTLVEVGTTNRTHLHDYERALTANTGAILKVHPSNYRISGFVRSVSCRDLAPLARRQGVALIADMGSGVLLDTTAFGLEHEVTVQEMIAAGTDIVTFSGDKLLGGPQAGLILGRRELIERCRMHPLARALRVGKMTLAALQATLAHYLEGDAHEIIPIWRMCAQSPQDLRRRAERVASGLADTGAAVRVVTGESAIGGGSLPGETLPTVLLAVEGEADTLAAAMHQGTPPIIARIDQDRLLIDLRTVNPEHDELILAALKAVLSG